MNNIVAEKSIGPRHPLDTSEVALDFTNLLAPGAILAQIDSQWVTPTTYPPVVIGVPSINAVPITIDNITIAVGKAVLFNPSGGRPDLDYIVGFQVTDDQATPAIHGGLALVAIRDGGVVGQALKHRAGGAYFGPSIIIYQGTFHRAAYGNAISIAFPSYLGNLSTYDSLSFVAIRGNETLTASASLIGGGTLQQKIVVELTGVQSDVTISDQWKYQIQGITALGNEKAVLVVGSMVVEPVL